MRRAPSPLGWWAPPQAYAEPVPPRPAPPEPAPEQVRARGGAGVPWGLDLAGAWAWRLLLVAAAGWVVVQLVATYAVLVLPLVISVLLAALADPAVRLLGRWLPRALAALVVVVVGVVVVGGLLGFVGRQIATGAADLATSAAQGIEQVRDWLVEGPLDASESQVDDAVANLRDAVASFAADGALQQALAIGSSAGNVLIGFFLALFALFFFLADGQRIWGWVVRLAPRGARGHVDSSGQVAWTTLTHYVRATVVVAVIDAIGITVWAAVLGVPFLAAIFVLTFLGAFIPVVGATLAGAVAVLVALVDGGFTTALVMLAGVLVVQQVEGNVLQPFLMGRSVSVHPLAVVVAVTAGSLVAGVSGALVAVPLVATANAVVLHLAGHDPGRPPPPSAETDAGPAPDPDAGPDPAPHPDEESR